MKNLSIVTAYFTTFCFFLAGFVGAVEKIDINAAPLEELIKIIHIGEARAQELISLRPFSSLDDLDRIKGIGPKRIEDIKAQGLAWVIEARPPSFKPLVVGAEKQPEEVFETQVSVPVQKSPLPLVTAGGVAVFSVIAILILKKNLN